MTNPRNRNMVKQAAHATQPAKVPSVPVVRTGDRAVDEAFRAIKEALDVRGGGAGNPWERWITARDLRELGLSGGTPGAMPSDASGFAVWTAHQAFQLVTLDALVRAVAALVQTETDGATTEEQLALIRRELGQLKDGVTQTQLSAAVSQLRAMFLADLATRLSAMEREIASAIAQAQAIAEQALTGVAAAHANRPTVGRIALDLGGTPRSSVTVEFDLPGVQDGDVIRLQPCGSTNDGALGGDEHEMDALVATAHCKFDGVVTAHIVATPGPVSGSRNFIYQVE